MSYDIYFNLHKKMFSVRHKGKVIAHADSIIALDVRFVVRKAGRLKVLKEKRKNVHAFVRATAYSTATKQTDFASTTRVSYNPYMHETFVKNGVTPIHNANMVAMRVVDKKPQVGVIK